MFPPAPSVPADPSRIAALRARIAAIGGGAANRQPSPVPLGVAAIDAALPWRGLPRAGLHEISAGDASAAAAGFCAFLLARFAAAGRTVVWCRRGRGLYAPALAAFGLDLSRLLIVYPRSERSVLQAMEEALRCSALAAVLGETGSAEPIALRRLQLAAEASGVAALVLRPAMPGLASPSPALPSPALPSPALTRWQVTAVPGRAENEDNRRTITVRWRLALQRCRTGIPAFWHVDWCDETHRLAVVAEFCDRPALPATVPAAPERRCAV
jgi:protein ImuA